MRIRNYKIYFLTIQLAFTCITVRAQRNSEKADKYFNQNVFDEAIKYYQMDIKGRDRKTTEYAMQRLADCYRITGEFEKAEEMYKKILKKKKKDADCYLNYALSLKSSAKYAEALEQFKEYEKLKPQDPMIKIFISSCDSAQKWLDETIGKEVKNIESINTKFSEFSPVIHPNGKLYFSSSRNGSKQPLISFDGGGEIERMDLFNINLHELTSVTKHKIENFEEINSISHDGAACFSEDGKEIYFTKTVKGKRKEGSNSILSTLQIFYSFVDSTGKWTNPVSAFLFNSNDYSVGHPSLSMDGKTIYYMSDKPGGLGKTDIYYSIKQSDGSWSAPINAGKHVNTFGHELFPYISENNFLYFSSNAHPGMGQLDVFRSALVEHEWTNVQNLKPPINSIGNDFGIVFDGKHNRGFVSSDRFNGIGAEDIYSFSNDVPVTLMLNKDTLIFYDKSIFDDLRYKLSTDSIETELSSSNGKYCIRLQPGTNYTLIIKKGAFPYNKIKLTHTVDSVIKQRHLLVKSEQAEIEIIGQCQEEDIQTGQMLKMIAGKVEDSEAENGLIDSRKNIFYFQNTLKPQTPYLIKISENYLIPNK